MLRILLEVVVPLVLPTLVFIGYSQVESRRAEARQTGARPPWWVSAPWFHLVAAGVALMAATLSFWALTSGAPRNGLYTPAHVEDGQIIHGTIAPKPAAPGRQGQGQGR